MGVSILMRPGTIMRSKGTPKVITPGSRSRAAAVLQEVFGQCPLELDDDCLAALTQMAAAASVYTQDQDNMWLAIQQAVTDHHCVTITLEY